MIGEILTYKANDDCRGCWGKALGAAFSGYTRAVLRRMVPRHRQPKCKGDWNLFATPRRIVPKAPRWRPEVECQGSSGDGLAAMPCAASTRAAHRPCLNDGRVQFITNKHRQACLSLPVDHSRPRKRQRQQPVGQAQTVGIRFRKKALSTSRTIGVLGMTYGRACCPPAALFLLAFASRRLRLGPEIWPARY